MDLVRIRLAQELGRARGSREGKNTDHCPLEVDHLLHLNCITVGHLNLEEITWSDFQARLGPGERDHPAAAVGEGAWILRGLGDILKMIGDIFALVFQVDRTLDIWLFNVATDHPAHLQNDGCGGGPRNNSLALEAKISS